MAEPARELIALVYDELRVIADRRLRQERQATLQPTAVVHEAYLRLADADASAWNDEQHFKAIAARVIRQVLVDHARSRGAQKRGGDWLRVTISAADAGDDTTTLDLVALDQALERLQDLSPRQASVVELRFFGGLTVEEIAAQLDVSPRTVKNDWRIARVWLWTELA